MNKENNISYNIEYSQDYIEWEAFIEEIVEMKVEYSDYADAKAVIAYIKSL